MCVCAPWNLVCPYPPKILGVADSPPKFSGGWSVRNPLFYSVLGMAAPKIQNLGGEMPSPKCRSEKPGDFCSGMVASPLAATVVTAKMFFLEPPPLIRFPTPFAQCHFPQRRNGRRPPSGCQPIALKFFWGEDPPPKFRRRPSKNTIKQGI